MEHFEWVLLGATIVQILCWISLCRYLQDQARKIAALDSAESRHWREHKNDYYEVRADHERLVTALGMKKTRPTGVTYVKKESK